MCSEEAVPVARSLNLLNHGLNLRDHHIYSSTHEQQEPIKNSRNQSRVRILTCIPILYSIISRHLNWDSASATCWASLHVQANSNRSVSDKCNAMTASASSGSCIKVICLCASSVMLLAGVSFIILSGYVCCGVLQWQAQSPLAAGTSLRHVIKFERLSGLRRLPCHQRGRLRPQATARCANHETYRSEGNSRRTSTL